MSFTYASAKAVNYYKSSLLFLVLSVVSAAFNYAYYPVIARFLSPAEFGAVQALIVILLQVGAIFSGLNLVTIYLVNKLDASDARRAVEVLQKLTTSFFVLATLVVTILQTAVLHFLHIDNRLYIFIVALDLITTIPFIIAFGYLQARRQFVSAGTLQLLVVLVKLGSGAFLAKRWGASGALLGIAFGQVLGMFIFWAVSNFAKLTIWDHKALLGLLPPSWQELSFIRPMAKNITAVFLVNVILIIYISINIIAARHYFAAHTSGLFTGAATLANAIIFVCLPLIGVLLPHLNIKNPASSREQFAKTATMIVLVSIVSIVGLDAFASKLLQIFGNDYPSMSYLLPKLGVMMSVVAGITLSLQVSAFYAPLRTAFISVAGLVALVAAVINRHASLTSFTSTMTAVFVTILFIGVLQVIWIYSHGLKKAG